MRGEGERLDERGTEVSAEGGEVTKSEREGPALRRSENWVLRRLVGGLGPGASVANVRGYGWRTEWGVMVRVEYRQQSRGAFDAIVKMIARRLYKVS